MRRGFRKTRQVMAGLSAAVLLMTSLPQNATYVYAAEQVEEQQPQTEETAHAQTEPELDETKHSSVENPSAEAETADGIENAESKETEEKAEQEETKNAEDKSDREETKGTEEKSDQEENEEEKTDVTDGDGEETDIEGETGKPGESTETEESIEFEGEEEEQETESADQASPQEQIVAAKLTGAYQFGDAPSKRGHVSVFSVDLTADTDIKELEEYLYQQMKERKETIDVQKYGISADKIGSIVTGVINENPDLYFVGKSIRWSHDGTNAMAVMLTYDDSYNDNAFRKAAEKALAVVKPGMSDLEKAIVLHDYLAVNCEYDKENYDHNTIPAASYTAYGTLVKRISVCQGYALAYKYLLKESGIECLMVTSSAMNHAWNLVKLDGEYYQVDVTWDDPTWDRIGRARHEYMFRSDDAFQGECEHYGWIVTEGSAVVDYKAADKSYDNAFWLDCDSPLVLVGEDCYYVTFDNTGVIKKSSLSDTTGTGTKVCDIGRWGVWNSNNYWQGAFSGLFYVNGRLYYNDASSIHSFAFDEAGEVIDKREGFRADTTDGYIYGSAFCQGKVLYSLHKDPGETGRETVLTADTTIETGEPSDPIVEKIELDQETLVLAVGGTAALQAVVTPNGADVDITWESSDNTVAAVSDGTVTATAVGSCTITASAGGEEAACEVTVTASAITDPDQETYTVTFNLQGHGTALEEYSTYTEIKKGSTIKRPAPPEAEGYEFTGWYKEADCQTLWDFDKDIVEGDITLYAGWKSSGNVDEEPNEEPNEKPVVSSVLFPGKKSDYSAVYTGEQIRPAMVVVCQYTDAGGQTKAEKLKLNVDYTVRYSNNVDAGVKTAQVTVRGIGGYTGVITSKFTITPKSMANVTLSPAGDIVFGGQPSVTVTDGTKELVEGRDYHINLSTKGSADTDTQSALTVEGVGNYTGTSNKSAKFNILREGTDILSIASKGIHVEFKNPAKRYIYNGKAQKPGVAVTDTETGKNIPASMYKVIYSNNINAGKGTAKAWVAGVSKNGKGYYGISEPLYFDIDQKDFKKVSASLSGKIPKIGSIEDIRKNIDNAIVIKDARHVLSESEYTIDYGDIKAVDDIKIGKQYPVTLTAVAGGNYIKDSQKIIKIRFGQLNLASRTAKMSVVITNVSQNEIAFRYNGILLEKGKDYTATVTKDRNKDTYTVKIKAVKDSAYKGSITFKKLQADQDAAGSDSVIPEIPGAKPAKSNNKDTQNYCWYSNYNWNWADTVKSYLYENQSGGLTRVEYIGKEIVAEDYDDSFHLCTSRKIPMELPIWGGFYAGDQYNFVFFGQNNSSEDDKTEVVRVVKYSKDWQRLGKASLCGANTTVPFDAGSLRCAGYGGYLYIRTCHEMYNNHQANMTFVVRQSDMTITDSYCGVAYSSVGYVSHSFNQFVLVDQNQNLVTLDHGDAYPRSIVLMRSLNAKAGGDKFSGRFENSNLVEFSGEIGENRTGASIGGFAETKNGYVTAFNYEGTTSGGPRAVYLGFTSKSGLDTKAAQITGYDGMRTPVLAPVGLDGGYLMWTDAEGNFYYTGYADGGTTGTVNKADACLSDCQPILHNGACVWYVTQNSVPAFYKLDVSSSEISKIAAK